MSKSRSWFGLAAGAVSLAIVLAGCSAAVPTQPPAGVPATQTPAGTQISVATRAPSGSPSVTSTPAASCGRLVVLADGPDGRRGLWALGSDSRWVRLADAPGATALGRHGDGIALAVDAGIEVRTGPDIATAGTTTALKWPGGGPGPAVVDLDVASGGGAALVTSKDGTFGYDVAGTDGVVTPLTPAPTQPFSPTVAWLDGSRLLVLSTDNLQVSRLAVVDPAAHMIGPARALGGVRVFGTSGDGRIVAAATEGAVYAGPLASFTGSTEPAPIATLADGQVTWAIALDEAGSKLFMLSGLVGPDGTVGSITELGYSRAGSGWTSFLDSAVPFGRAIDQVFLSGP